MWGKEEDDLGGALRMENTQAIAPGYLLYRSFLDGVRVC